MSTNIIFNGGSYIVPAIADASWGTNVANYLIAISTGCLQKTGGTFTLSAEVDFGGTYGLKGVYFKSKTTNIAAAGVLLLAKSDTINWRNNANGADLALGINGTDALIFNSIVMADISSSQTFTNKSMSGSANTFTNLPTSALTGLISPANGGTGVANNSASTLTISGSFATTLTVTGATGLTLPTSGTLTSTANTLAVFAATTSSQLAGVISDETGSGALVFANTPTLVTPVIGVATATSINKMAITAPATSSTLAVADGKTLTASNTLTFTGTDASSVAFGSGGTVAYIANKLSVFAATSSSELAGVISDETGTGALVFANTPTLVTPVLGVATATSVNKMAITAPATSSTLAVADGKTATISNTLTFAGTDGNTMTFPSGSSTVMTLASADTVAGVKTFADGSLKLSGSSSGASTLKAPAAASTFVHTLPAATTTLVGTGTTDTLTNKTLTSPTITGESSTAIAVLALRDTSAAFDVTMAATSSTTISAGRTLTLDMVNASYTIKVPPLSNFSTLADGTANTVLSTLGSNGGYAWVAALSSSLNQFNVSVGNASNAATSLNTSLVGDITTSVLSQSYTVTSAAPGVFTVTTAPATGSKAYVTVTQNGFTANTTYYVTNVSGTTFKLATTLANAVAGTNITSSGTTAGTIISGGFVLSSGVIGTTTNSSATAGYVGELMLNTLASGSALSLSSGVDKTIASFTLTPGQWEISGALTFVGAATTSVTSYIAGISQTTNSVLGTQGIPASDGQWFVRTQESAQVPNGAYFLPVPPTSIQLSSSTSFYIVAEASFTTSTMTAYGYIRAIRVR